MSTKILACVADYLGVTPAQIVSSRIDDEAGIVYVVIDKGIKGSPKYSIPLLDLSPKYIIPLSDSPAVKKRPARKPAAKKPAARSRKAKK